MTYLLSHIRMYRVVRWILGLSFIVSGTIKLLDLSTFSTVVDAFGILPLEWAGPFAVLISLAEVLSGAGLIADIKGSLMTILLLLLVFGAVLGFAIHMGYDIDCGCFGEKDPVAKAFGSLTASLALDVCLIGMVFYLYDFRRRNQFTTVSLSGYVNKLK
jgi:uncharacterized membrane protein YphA (DoxX/SURF4 family)